MNSGCAMVASLVRAQRLSQQQLSRKTPIQLLRLLPPPKCLPSNEAAAVAGEVVETVVNGETAETNVAAHPIVEEITPIIIISLIKTKATRLLIKVIQNLTKKVQGVHQMSQIVPAPSIGNTPEMLHTAAIL